MLLPGLLFWGLLPLVAGAEPIRMALPALGAGAGIGILALAALRPALIVLVPAIVAMELSANGFIGQTFRDGEVPSRVHPSILNVPFTPLAQPRFRASDYLDRGPIALRLQSEDDRYISLDPTRVTERGYLEHQGPASWGLLANQRATLFGLEDAQGYNPVQPLPYWKFVRAVVPREIKYNAAFLVEPSTQSLDLLDVAWIVGPAGSSPGSEAIEVARDGQWALYHNAIETPRATLLTRWTVVRGEDGALAAVTEPEFEPSAEIVLEEDPGLPQTDERSSEASYESLRPGQARVVVNTNRPGVLLVRNTYDQNWHARLDGRPVSLLRADSFLQAVAVPVGRHVIELEYHDPWVGRGLLGSGVAIGGLVAAGFFLHRRWRRELPPEREHQKDGSDEGRESGDAPGQLGGERPTEHRQEEETRPEVESQGKNGDQADRRGKTPDSEPPGRQKTGKHEEEEESDSDTE
jgi:hypothetical protein